MLFLLQHVSPWILSALALGVVFGLLARRAGRGPSGGSVAVLALAYLGGLAAAVLQIAPGRSGFWLETGLLIFGAYAVGGFCACALMRLFGARAGATPPEWIAAAQDLIARAEAFSANAPRAAAAFDAAAGLLTPAAKPAPLAPSVAGALTTRPRSAPAPAAAGTAQTAPLGGPDDLALIHGLDRDSADVLRGLGLSDFAGLARLTPARRAEIALQLRLHEAVLAYWSAQALLLAHGVETDFSRERKAGAQMSRERSAHAGASAQMSRERSAHAGASAQTSPDPALDGPSAQMLSAALPQLAAPQANDAFYPGERPYGLLAPLDGKPDDLRRIAGLDEAASTSLNRLGVWSFRQIAGWSSGNARWIESYLASPGRVAREQWREQASALAGLTKAASES